MLWWWPPAVRVLLPVTVLQVATVILSVHPLLLVLVAAAAQVIRMQAAEAR
jgi:hypothetical protein